MDMKDTIINNNLQWNTDMVNKLNRFPIVLHSNEWIKGTNYHYHPGFEIHITQDGAGTMVVGKQVLLQTPRSVLVFRGMVPHQMISKSSYKRTVISINSGEGDSHSALPSLLRIIDFGWIPEHSCLSFSLNPKQFQQLEELCRMLQHELKAREVGWERMALSHTLEVTVLLQRSLVESQPKTLYPQSSGKIVDLVQMCSDYVCHNLGDDLTLKTISKRFAVSEEYLTRSFTKEMGISFYQYVLLQRVAEGKRLLREAAGVSITDIAYMIGFPSSSIFSKHYKALTGETPSAYRQKWDES